MIDAAKISEISLSDLQTDRQLEGDITQVQRLPLGEGRESLTHKALLKVGQREVPVAVKIPKRERPDYDLSYKDLDQIRRGLEAQGKLPMPYYYGLIKGQIIVQEFIPGRTLDTELESNPDFLTDQKRRELVEMSLDLGTAIERATEGKFYLTSLSHDDILVAHSDEQTSVKTDGKLICVDPSITARRIDSNLLETEKNILRENLFKLNDVWGNGTFEIQYVNKRNNLGYSKTKVDALTACFVQQPEDLTQLRRSMFDLDIKTREQAQQAFTEFCEKSGFYDPKLMTFAFEVFFADADRTYHPVEEQEVQFKRSATFEDFQKFYSSLTEAPTSPAQSPRPQ